MRYIGNKQKLLNDIQKIISKLGVKTILDGFSGTATVANFLHNKGYTVSTCDIQYYSYILQYCKVKVNNNNLKFENTDFNNKEEVINYFNNLKEEELVEGFIYNNYSAGGTECSDIKRLYFSDINAKLIDTIRSKVEEWFNDKKINEQEYMWLLGMLIEAVSKVSNTTSVYAAFLKKLHIIVY
jgi:adenine-specific DNA-methyltransferase